MSRIPPLKIPRAVIEALAGMPPSISGRILSWGWRCYNGETIFLDEEEARDADVRSAIALGVDLFDSTALALNIIDVSAFTAARIKDIEISAKRAKAREKRFEAEAEAEQSNVVSLRRYADGSAADGYGTKGDHPSSQTPAGRAAAANLVLHGISRAHAEALIDRFSREHGAEAVLGVTEKMKGRRVASPDRYLASALKNLRDDLTGANVVTNPNAPRAVRRQISPRKDGAWDFLGWTCRDHPRAARGQEGRRKVWRTDAGRLAYKQPGEGETPPTFEQDPGIMEVE